MERFSLGISVMRIRIPVLVIAVVSAKGNVPHDVLDCQQKVKACSDVYNGDIFRGWKEAMDKPAFCKECQTYINCQKKALNTRCSANAVAQVRLQIPADYTKICPTSTNRQTTTTTRQTTTTTTTTTTPTTSSPRQSSISSTSVAKLSTTSRFSRGVDSAALNLPKARSSAPQAPNVSAPNSTRGATSFFSTITTTTNTTNTTTTTSSSLTAWDSSSGSSDSAGDSFAFSDSAFGSLNRQSMVSRSSAHSSGITASGSSGSYYQIWQWLLLAGLVSCCLCMLAMLCCGKKSKKRSGWKKPTPAPPGAAEPVSSMPIATEVPLLPRTQPMPEPVVESLLPSPDLWANAPLVSPPFIMTSVVAAVPSVPSYAVPSYEIYPGPATTAFPYQAVR